MHNQDENSDSWIKTEYGLFHKKEKVKFVRISHRESLKDILNILSMLSRENSFGILCETLKDDDVESLRKKKISYYIPNQEFKIYRNDESNISDVAIEKNDKDLPPTLIVSPSGLEIVDTIIKLNEEELEKTASAICKQYKLSQAKLSKIMTEFGCRKLLALRDKLLELDFYWWINAFESPITQRKMTPSKTKRTRRYVYDRSSRPFEPEHIIVQLKDKGIEAVMGGMSYLEVLGRLKTSQYDLLVRADQIIDLVNELNLRVAKKNEVDNVIFVTPLIGEVKSEGFYSKYSNDNKELNRLRFLWGTNYEEVRVKELRSDLLKEYLNEARKRNNR